MTSNQMDEVLNFIPTGGQFGKVRRCPTFVISKHETGNYIARDETCKFNSVAAVAPTLEEIEQLLKVECDRRTRMY